jgi:hypothetical protein
MIMAIPLLHSTSAATVITDTLWAYEAQKCP